ncbi:hypothetical protein EV44_g5493 [Erysiphe necator]|uniref:Uncharacterized protein n=1 Tax=Uncinula necator TaxID=52586 RepID=A0A0B1PIT5_UNCNE|nr:hypothetical protein EV44_g5493 [Erysiphe necator]
MQDSDNEYNQNLIEYDVQETAMQSTATTNYDDEFPCLEGIENQSENQNVSENVKSTPYEGSKFQLMDKVKGHFDITNPYLQEIEKDSPRVGADFMALLVEGASRVILGQRILFQDA